jgi:hypothetical protein
MRAIVSLSLLGAAAVVAACVARPTEVTTTWLAQNPVPTPFKRTVAVFLSSDTELRRRVEDRLAERLPNAVASYTLVPYDRFSDVQGVRTELSNQGFDGAVVMRLLNVEARSGSPTRTSSTPSEDLVEYLRQGPRNALQPGRGETVITMESRVYSLASGKPLWVGRSESFNPVSANELVDMIVNAFTDEIRRQTRFF